MKDLIEAAKKAQKNAYSPYSKVKVGTAILGDDGKVYVGCNVENISYGAVICAERSAIASGISHGMKSIKKAVIISDFSPPWSPCGICCQVFSEFSKKDLPILLLNTQGEKIEITLGSVFTPFSSPEKLVRYVESKKI